MEPRNSVDLLRRCGYECIRLTASGYTDLYVIQQQGVLRWASRHISIFDDLAIPMALAYLKVPTRWNYR